jgi:hypothetical protein
MASGGICGVALPLQPHRFRVIPNTKKNDIVLAVFDQRMIPNTKQYSYINKLSANSLRVFRALFVGITPGVNIYQYFE